MHTAFLIETGGVFSLAAILGSAAGFGFGMVAMAILPLFSPVVRANPLVSLLGIAMYLIMTVRLWRFVDRSHLLMFFLGSLLGLPIGTYFLVSLPNVVLVRSMGALILAYVLFVTIANGRVRMELRGPAWTLAAGLASGIFGAALNTGGPPIIIYCSSMGWERDKFRATLLAYFLAMTSTKCVLFAATGILNPVILSHAALLLPSVFAGTAIGAAISRRIPEGPFRYVVAATMAVLGATLLVRG